MSKHSETKVNRGEPLSIQASTWNTLVDVARRFRRDNASLTLENVPGSEEPSLKLSILNGTATATLSPFSVLKIDAPLENVGVDIYNNSTTSFKGLAPTANTDTIVVTQVDLDKDTIGPAVYLGVTPVKVLVNDATHKYARPVVGQTGYMESATAGPAIILWKAATSGTVFAIINLLGVTSFTGDGSGGDGGGTCGCGWIAGVKDGDCFTLSLESPTGGPTPLALYWEGDSDTGEAKPAIDPLTTLPYLFTICGVDYAVRLYKNDDGEPALELTESGESYTYTHTLSLDCCFTNGAYFTGNGDPECFD